MENFIWGYIIGKATEQAVANTDDAGAEVVLFSLSLLWIIMLLCSKDIRQHLGLQKKDN